MIRKATIKDIKSIHRLLAIYGQKGMLLSRPLSQLYDHLRDFFVYESEEDKVIGCCALQFCWEDLAEIRSLAVDEPYWRKHIGAELVDAALDEAKKFFIRRVFTLTYQPEFFSKKGFSCIDRADLPLKVWNHCVLCVKFPDCDETAMVKDL